MERANDGAHAGLAGSVRGAGMTIRSGYALRVLVTRDLILEQESGVERCAGLVFSSFCKIAGA